MTYKIAVNNGSGVTRHTVIGDVDEFVNRAYDDGALGVTVLVLA